MLKRLKGFSLIELMIALALNIVLFAALIGIFLSNVGHYQKFINANRLNQQLQNTLSLMANDIRRAGYWANAKNDIGTHQNNNPFMSVDTDIRINGNCILFAYDHNNDGSLPGVSSTIDDERYGYRLNAEAIQSRPPGAAFDCSASPTNWENVTDTHVVRITGLTFGLDTKSIVTGPGTKGITMRTVTITITGQLATDSSITKTVSQVVRVRNDKFVA